MGAILGVYSGKLLTIVEFNLDRLMFHIKDRLGTFDPEVCLLSNFAMGQISFGDTAKQ
jgi:hypothetical protein